jgi:hypothetical protein
MDDPNIAHKNLKIDLSISLPIQTKAKAEPIS